MPLSCAKYFCPTDGSCIKRPIQSQGLAPFVRMKFPPMPGVTNAFAGAQVITTVDPAGKPDLTVGNDSNPPYNRAIIKSFSYGSSDGNGAEIEVFDEDGGEFGLFVNKLVKVSKDSNSYGCSVEWGWSLSDCDGNKCAITSSQHFFIINSIDMNFSKSGMTFKIQLLDLMEPLFETRQTDVIQDVTLKKAIEELFTKRTNPQVKSVLFKRMTPSAGGKVPCNNLIDNNSLGNQSMIVGGCGGNGPSPLNLKDLTDFKFKGDLETKTANWHCKNQSPLATAREWLRDKMTDKDKGVIFFWNSASQESQLILLENPMPKCWSKLEDEQCSRSIGTYIVNGGADTPVISFDPQIKFTFATAARAGAGVDSMTAEGERTRPSSPCPENSNNDTDSGPNPVDSGDATFVQMSENFNTIYGPGNLRLAIRGTSAQELANKSYENIEAEMRIQGDPSLDNPHTIKTKTVSIVCINPYHLQGSGDNQITSGSFDKNCPAWLVGPPCNEILSNKSWKIDGCFHEIKEGSYVTTLKISLPAPTKTIIP